jgi:excisionase family DNA binding protein
MTVSWITMAELDRKLGLSRGTSNALRRKGVFEGTRFMGRLWAVSSEELQAVKDSIEAYRSKPDFDVPTVTVREAAKRLAVAESTVYNLIRLGRLTTIPVPSGRIHVTIGSIEHYRQHRLPAGVGIRIGKKRHV